MIHLALSLFFVSIRKTKFREWDYKPLWGCKLSEDSPQFQLGSFVERFEAIPGRPPPPSEKMLLLKEMSSFASIVHQHFSSCPLFTWQGVSILGHFLHILPFRWWIFNDNSRNWNFSSSSSNYDAGALGESDLEHYQGWFIPSVFHMVHFRWW